MEGKKRDPHRCKNFRIDWSHCTGCDGRIHEEDCTSRRNPKIDCCLKRHEELVKNGVTKGLFDSSIDMVESLSWFKNE